MAKSKTPSYVLELKLNIQPFQQHKLERFFEATRVIYNTCLSIALKRSNRLKRHQPYLDLLKQESSKSRNDALKQMRLDFGFSEYQLHEAVVSVKKHFKGIGINEAQKLATRAFQAVEKMHYGKAKKVHFKRKGDMDSVENKSNSTGLREKDGLIVWNDLQLAYIIKKNDTYAQLAHLDRTKFVRMIRRTIRGKVVFYVQLIKEGIPPLKNRTTQDGDVGIDIGTSTIAIVSDEVVQFAPLIENEQTFKRQAQKMRRIQRKMDRSRRATNPNKFHADGTINRANKERWNHFDGMKVQRDLYSAFLIQHVQDDLETIDVKKCTEKFDAFLEKHNSIFNL